MSVKIINILANYPPYDLYSREPRPKINWDTPSGAWVGIWMDWPGRLGNAVLKLTDEFVYEVWQPDPKADKIYSHTFENRLTHRLFPANFRKKLFGFKIINELHSPLMFIELKKISNTDALIIHLNGPLTEINQDILENFKNIPKVFSFHGEVDLPSTSFFVLSKNFLSKFNLLIEHLKIRGNINSVPYITYQSEKNLEHLKRIYNGRLEKITMGSDFSFFQKLNKAACRQELGLPKDKFIMLTIANLIERKQVDKFIRVLTALMPKFDFLYILIGHGAEEYEKYLRQIAFPLLQEEKIKFCGYLRGEKLAKYLNSADLFISTSRSEGGPVAVMEAFACELPVFCTKTGFAAELLEKEGVGCLVGTKDYALWKDKLEIILKSNNAPKALNRYISEEYFSWKNVAKKFIDIYRDLATD